jgi:hypothetical protein
MVGADAGEDTLRKQTKIDDGKGTMIPSNGLFYLVQLF